MTATPNKTDAVTGSYGTCRVIIASHSPSIDPKSCKETTMRVIYLFAISILICGCREQKLITVAPEAKPQSHYQIEGFYVSPLTKILIGDTQSTVRHSLGDPTEINHNQFREPNRVKLTELPQFDEQWGYSEGLANNWVFFRNGRLVAAFREESDF